MDTRRWYNPNMPQTLSIAQILLYLEAFFVLLSFLQITFSDRYSYSLVGKVLLVASIGTGVFGAFGIANERKIGYQVAVLASFMPLIARVITVLQHGSITRDLGFILIGNSILNALFEYALIALLLHPQSSHHQKIWFH